MILGRNRSNGRTWLGEWLCRVQCKAEHQYTGRTWLGEWIGRVQCKAEHQYAGLGHFYAYQTRLSKPIKA